MTDKILQTAIDQWLLWDKNEKTRQQIEELVHKKDMEQLRILLLDRQTFGTAGIRAEMGPGNSCLNDLVIIQTNQGLVTYMSRVFDQLKEKGIVVGFDARHNSHSWAQLTASIFINHGVPVYLYPKICPTPFVPYGIIEFGCCAGIMITASHNPKNDNGFKVYWNNGAQIVSPHDKGIQACIEECLEPWETSWDTSVLQMSPLKKDPLPQVMDSYYKYLVAMSYDRQLNANTAIKFTFTPMHGVGEEYVEHAFSVCGFKPFVKVEKQKDPDPDFPTVPFPNPEEGKCALDLAMQAAAEAHSGVILANDPDADRLGVAEKLPNGEWKIFTGNEIGALLGWWLWHCYKHKNPQCDPNDVYMISTAVSSKILAAIAKKEGFHFVETLTGFKWMGNKAEEFMKKGKTVLFAFEEAIGFMCGPRPLDKDGINACIRLAELVAYLEQIEKRSLSEKLLNIYSTYGYHVNRNSYYLTHDPERIKVLFNRLRNFPGSSIGYPERCGTFPIKHVRDLTVGYDSSQVNKKPILPTSKSSQMITFYLENGCVATLRTSGTEPKVKYYAEICTEPDGMDWAALDEIISTVEQHIIEDFMQPSVNGLLPKPV